MDQTAESIQEGLLSLDSETGDGKTSSCVESDLVDVGQAVNAFIAGLSTTLVNRLEERLLTQLEAESIPKKEQAILLASIAERLLSLETRLREICVVQENLASGVDSLSGDVIRDRVEIPLIKRVLHAYGVARRAKASAESINADHGSEVTEALTYVLEDYGYDAIWPSVDTDFDPKIHRIMKKVDTEEPSKDRKIIDVVFAGLRIGDSVVIPASVSIFVFERND